MTVIGRRSSVVGRQSACHAHVERRTFTKGEPARFIVELMRRDAEVEDDAVERDAGEFGNFFDVGEVGQDRAEAALRLEGCEARARGGDGIGIAIEAGDVGAGFEEREGVPAAAERAVEHAPGAVQRIEHFRDEHGCVVGRVELCWGHGGKIAADRRPTMEDVRWKMEKSTTGENTKARRSS